MCDSDENALFWEVKGQNFHDSRGTLTSFDSSSQGFIKFVRFFTIYNVPKGVSRGGHAHKKAYQGFSIAHGSCTLHLKRRKKITEIDLVKKDTIIVVPPLTFVEMNNFSCDSALIVFSTQEYDPNDYIYEINQS